MSFLDNIPLKSLLIGAVFLGLAPLFPEPHLFGKVKMLLAGTLTKPLDIFDLFMHGALPVLVLIKLIRMKNKKA
ncbi:MAG: hypothetical protein V3V04_00245 [Rhizobiaceae bacterium]